MTHTELASATFLPRIIRIGKNFSDEKYRITFVARQIASSIANQIRALRGDENQTVFGRRLAKPQTVVSRLEDEGYGRVNVQTLIEIAQKLDIALIIRFVTHQDFLRLTSIFASNDLAPHAYQQAEMDNFLENEMVKANLDEASRAFVEKENEEIGQPLRSTAPEIDGASERKLADPLSARPLSQLEAAV